MNMPVGQNALHPEIMMGYFSSPGGWAAGMPVLWLQALSLTLPASWPT
ncbi:MAG: hypothetical protein JXQ73_01095 [Phycisphaerae bacterium]|nr:hypothetical protein [Phycisphaerae bacterium]